MLPTKIIYLYRITNSINTKVYIGQTIDPNSRWRAHKKRSTFEEPKQVIHHAMKKYGSDVFEFEIIACSLNQSDADWMEETLIRQHQSLAPTGYNVEMGGIKRPAMSQATKDKLSALVKQRYQANPELRAKLINMGLAYNQQLKDQGLPLPIHTLENKQKSMAAFQAARDGYQQQHGFDWAFGVSQRPGINQRRSESMRKVIQSLPHHWSKGRQLSPEHKAVFKHTQPLSPEHKTALMAGGKDTQFKDGQAPHNKKLTSDIAVQMKVKYAQGVSIRALSREYNINTKSISYMLKGKTNELSSKVKKRKC
jgi:group I intron endonuclease